MGCSERNPPPNPFDLEGNCTESVRDIYRGNFPLYIYIIYFEALQNVEIEKCYSISLCSPSVSWHDINVIKKLYLYPFGWHICNFWIKKIIFMPLQENTRRCSSIPRWNYDLYLFLFDYWHGPICGSQIFIGFVNLIWTLYQISELMLKSLIYLIKLVALLLTCIILYSCIDMT
jgi:hypothetical protein